MIYGVCVCMCLCIVEMGVGGVSWLATTHLTAPLSNVGNEDSGFCLLIKDTEELIQKLPRALFLSSFFKHTCVREHRHTHTHTQDYKLSKQHES